MSDLARTIIKWVLLIALVILLVLLVLGVVNHNKKNKQKEAVRTHEPIKVDTIDDGEDKDNEDKKDSTLVVNLGDTASTRGVSVWIGIVIIGTTGFYLYKKHQVNE